MGWLSVLLSGVAAYLFYRTDHTSLIVVAIVSGIGCLWSWGVMHNHATEIAERRPDYKGGFFDFNQGEVDAVPNWVTVVNIVFSVCSFVLLIVGIIFAFRD